MQKMTCYKSKYFQDLGSGKKITKNREFNYDDQTNITK